MFISKSVPLCLFLIALSTLTAVSVSANDSQPGSTGTIKGRVVEAVNQAPVIGASVLVVGTRLGAATDETGDFRIADVPVGSYSLTISGVAYERISQSDVIVRPKRITFVQAELVSRSVEIKGMSVTADYFSEKPWQPTSTTEFSGEEVRRSPGTAGDVSRIVATLPSIAKVNDQLNSMIVRGGTPTENGFYLDNIEIPNINHYPLEGSSGGPIGLLNVDFVRDVSFSAGGFSAAYGDRLSSIMDISFREGNREEFDGQLMLDFAGAGFTGEGPIAHGKGSWMLSVRRSFLDLLVDAIGTGVAPRYSDYQGKLVYDLNASHQLTFLGVAGVDAITFERKQAIDDSLIFYGTYKGSEFATGVNWRYLWGRKGYSNTSVSMLSTDYNGTFNETKSDIPLSVENSTLSSAQVRNVNTLLLNESSHFEFGFDTKYFFDNYNLRVAEYTNPIGDTVPPLVVAERPRSPRAGLFVNLTASPSSRLSTTVGLRYDYFEYNDHSSVSPRLALVYRLTDRTALNAATGIYYQNLPLVLLTQHSRNKELRDPVAYHAVAGISHLVTENTKLTVEGYYKSYDHFPVDPDQPQLFVVDELVIRGFMGNYENLQDIGKARAYGVEATLQKKLVEGTYGLVSGSYFKSEYKGLDGIWRDRIYDNRLLFSVEGGYKPNNRWEFSTRWIFAGGAPYTPLDLEASQLINRSVLDEDRVNESRYPAYHSLNLRCDRRFSFKGSNLVAYLSVWNVYNRKNVAQYYWNEIGKHQSTLNQWTMLPVFGVEYEF